METCVQELVRPLPGPRPAAPSFAEIREGFPEEVSRWRPRVTRARPMPSVLMRCRLGGFGGQDMTCVASDLWFEGRLSCGLACVLFFPPDVCPPFYPYHLGIRQRKPGGTPATRRP